jgi:hypothetical protein
MKKLWVLISILVVTILIGVLFWKNRNSTGAVEINSLQLRNPEKITRIFLSPNNPQADFVTLEKTGEHRWIAKNDKKQYDADSHYVNRLLFWLMKKIEVKSPVSDQAEETVSRDIIAEGIKVVFYEGEEAVKTIYVGGTTADGLGSFMHLPGTDRPVIVQVPGFDGTPAVYFSNKLQDWRSSVLIDLDIPQIARLDVLWHEEPRNSFSILMKDGVPQLLDASGRALPGKKNSMLAYLDMFKNVARASGDMPGINRMPRLRDSIRQSQPFFSLSITDLQGKIKHLRMFHRAVSDETYALRDKIGQLKRFETDTYWGMLEGEPEIWELQDIVMRNRMKKLPDFLP